jgi:hypothetical protein
MIRIVRLVRFPHLALATLLVRILDQPDKAKKNPDKKLTAEQQKTQDDFAAGLAKLGDLCVNDLFGT